MAFNETAKLKGSSQIYRLHPLCKKYTLRDYGFQETKQGNFEYNRPIRPHFADSREIRFKMQVNKTVTGLSLNVTTPNGLQSLDIYKGDKYAPFIKAVAALFKDMEENHILQAE